MLAGIGDLERSLARLHTSTLTGIYGGRDADHVILYEDSAKIKVIQSVVTETFTSLQNCDHTKLDLYDKRRYILTTDIETLLFDVKVKALVTAIQGLEAAQKAACMFQDVRENFTSTLLKSIVTPGDTFPDISELLAEIAEATDWQLALETGQVIPSQVPARESA